uniref:Uncharacterized protein n=1 Tax=Eutreptiella gymnastica TaxID=73025 RepID=A0A7S4D3B4_9EUGL
MQRARQGRPAHAAAAPPLTFLRPPVRMLEGYGSVPHSPRQDMGYAPSSFAGARGKRGEILGVQERRLVGGGGHRMSSISAHKCSRAPKSSNAWHTGHGGWVPQRRGGAAPARTCSDTALKGHRVGMCSKGGEHQHNIQPRRSCG